MADNQQQQAQTDIISQTVGALALAYIDRTLREGKSVVIPSLGIIIEGDKPQGTQGVQNGAIGRGSASA